MMPDVKYAGGLAEMLRIGAALAAHGVEVSPHNPSGPVSHVRQPARMLGAARVRHARDAVRRNSLFDAFCGRRIPASEPASRPFRKVRARRVARPHACSRRMRRSLREHGDASDELVRRLEPLAGIVAVVALWALVARIAANSTLVPSPAIVWQAFVAMLDGDLPRDISRAWPTWASATDSARWPVSALALAAGSSRWLEAVLDPLADSCARSARSPGSRSRSSCSAWAGWSRSS
jgi:hypothetical protein